jgi:hypothetical protein
MRRVGLRCPGCGREMFDGARFCQYCGTNMYPPPELAQVTPGVDFILDKRVMRLGFALLAIAVIGSVVLSPLLVVSESEKYRFDVAPGSYYAVRFEVYGYGMITQTDSQLTGSSMGVYVLELSPSNYERFVDGKDYDYIGYTSRGPAGEGHSTESGTIWAKYVVFVNDSPETVTFEYSYKCVAFVSLLVAAPLFGGAMLVFLIAVVLSKRRPWAVKT